MLSLIASVLFCVFGAAFFLVILSSGPIGWAIALLLLMFVCKGCVG